VRSIYLFATRKRFFNYLDSKPQKTMKLQLISIVLLLMLLAAVSAQSLVSDEQSGFDLGRLPLSS
jgi:hypothetical protein